MWSILYTPLHTQRSSGNKHTVMHSVVGGGGALCSKQNDYIVFALAVRHSVFWCDCFYLPILAVTGHWTFTTAYPNPNIHLFWQMWPGQHEHATQQYNFRVFAPFNSNFSALNEGSHCFGIFFVDLFGRFIIIMNSWLRHMLLRILIAPLTIQQFMLDIQNLC